MQVEHKTEKGTLSFELLPNEAIIIGKNIEGNSFGYSLNGIPHFIDAKDGEMIIGLTSEVTDEKAKMMVDEMHCNDGLYFRCKDYCSDADFIGLVFSKTTYLSSFKSLMQHLQVYEVNPYECPEYGDFKSRLKWAQEWEKYKQAESRTGKCIVLFKPNEK